MGDDEAALERVGRSRRPGLWVGAWLVGLATVVVVAVAGRGASSEGVSGPAPPSPPPIAAAPVATSTPAPTAAPVPTSRPALPDGLPRILRPFGGRPSSSPRPLPTLGDDGLVGGQVYSSARPGG